MKKFYCTFPTYCLTCPISRYVDIRKKFYLKQYVVQILKEKLKNSDFSYHENIAKNIL